jgi:hypothetical protein
MVLNPGRGVETLFFLPFSGQTQFGIPSATSPTLQIAIFGMAFASITLRGTRKLKKEKEDPK